MKTPTPEWQPLLNRDVWWRSVGGLRVMKARVIAEHPDTFCVTLLLDDETQRRASVCDIYLSEEAARLQMQPYPDLEDI